MEITQHVYMKLKNAEIYTQFKTKPSDLLIFTLRKNTELFLTYSLFQRDVFIHLLVFNIRLRIIF